MKRYFKHFWIFFCILLICGIITGVVVSRGLSNPKPGYVRGNKDYVTDERVFDTADLLSDEEEQKLRDLIALREDECGCAIVLVTLNQQIGNGWEALRDWADAFYEEYRYGYNKPVGDGALLVDNWYSFGDYNGDTWLCTTGRVESAYSSSDIDSLLDDVCEVVNDDPYEAYRIYVNGVAKHMKKSEGFLRYKLPVFAVVLVPLVIAVIYFFINFSAKVGKDTTTPLTYVTGGKPVEERHEDVFLTKSVHKRKIETSSGGGGGGGHHISSGGFSHGGGGHHH